MSTPRRANWRQSHDSRCNFDSLSLFTLQTEKGVTVATINPADKVFRWAAIGGWFGEAASYTDAVAAVESLESVKSRL